jgi:hypothetical protein
VPHDVITIREDVVEKTTLGGHDMVVQTKYEAPADSEGGIADDEFKERDLAIAANMMKWLQREYPGHPWGAVSDLRQGIVKINIPILMGFEDYWIVNLRTHDIIEGMAQGAGQILERYGLRRGRFHLGEFLEARAQHSKLIIKKRPIPE